MNCKQCHHTIDAHMPSQESRALTKFGKCLVRTCTCKQFVEPIEEIDDELVQFFYFALIPIESERDTD